MQLGPVPVTIHSSEPVLRGLLGGMSIFTMLMTIPQVPTIWLRQQANGVSIVSWSAYLISGRSLVLFWGKETPQEHLLAVCRFDCARRRGDYGGYHFTARQIFA